MALTVKAYLKKRGCREEIRRFSIDAEVPVNYEYMRQKLESIFPALAQTKFITSWQDDEGDYVTFSSDEELQMGPLEKVTNGLVKIYIKTVDVNASGVEEPHFWRPPWMGMGHFAPPAHGIPSGMPPPVHSPLRNMHHLQTSEEPECIAIEDSSADSDKDSSDEKATDNNMCGDHSKQDDSGENQCHWFGGRKKCDRKMKKCWRKWQKCQHKCQGKWRRGGRDFPVGFHIPPSAFMGDGQSGWGPGRWGHPSPSAFMADGQPGWGPGRWGHPCRLAMADGQPGWGPGRWGHPCRRAMRRSMREHCGLQDGQFDFCHMKRHFNTGNNRRFWWFDDEVKGSTTDQAEKSANNEKLSSTDMDSKIAVAMEKMAELGFHDDGGWLKRLLIAKDGDIERALDALTLQSHD